MSLGTETGFAGTRTALAQAAEGGGAVIDRDTNARANLGMRGVYGTCGVDDIIPGYVPADQEEDDGDEGGDGGEEGVDDGEGGADEEEVFALR
ncbi:hypothetical protein JKP88DRAFT_279458 [Tribonema minus]|uniref:Uncharacterized protein n=1 Tax=Tribonema minus TaxID=303371 RepID=A0A835YT44_9STRA|nr:hypothetical protein JKP88DRAFT_279458 [Tribonema minus]